MSGRERFHSSSARAAWPVNDDSVPRVVFAVIGEVHIFIYASIYMCPTIFPYVSITHARVRMHACTMVR